MTAQVQNNGLARITSLLQPVSWFVGWGTGSAAAATANNLVTAATESRVSGTASQQTGTATNDTLRLTATITATGARAITEVGAFDGAGSGNPPTGANLDIYGDFAAINLVSGDSIAFTLDTKFA